MNRRGVVTPLVILVLVLTTVLALAITSASQTDYQQSALVGHGIRARELALAAAEEARAVVAAAAAGEWKEELLAACAKQAGSLTDPLPPEDQRLLERDLALPAAAALVVAAGGELRQARATFTGFRHIGYGPDDLFLRDGAYYQAPEETGLEAAGTRRAARDWIGYVRLDVKVAFGRAERGVSEIHDVKIVSLAPPAPEFGLCSWMANTDETARREALVKGGAFHLFAGGQGRAYVRGPFDVATYGYKDGTGGRSVGRATASLRPSTWWGWQAVPGPRAAVIPRENIGGLPLSSPAQGRPEKESSSIVYWGLGENLYQGLVDHDPGILLENGSQYVCESRRWDDRDRPFSLFGDPEVTGDFELPRTVWGHTNADGSLEWRGPGDQITGGDARVGNDATPPGSSENDRDGLYTEGDLRMTCRIAKLESGHTNPVREVLGDLVGSLGDLLPGEAHYSVSAPEERSWPYGLHHEFEREGSLWQAIARSFRFFLDVALILTGAGVIDIGLMADGALSEAGTIAVNAATKLEELTRQPAQQLPAGGSVDTSKVSKLLPPRWRPAGRAVTRRYRSLAEVLEKSGGALALDGVVECTALDAQEVLEYQGRGLLYTANPEAKLPGRVMPVAATDWLTIQHESSAEMLSFEPARADGDAVRASVYASQGVRAEGRLEIQGNLTCGFINKSRIPRTGRVDVRYATDVLRGAFDDADWYAVAVSNRICQSVEW